MKPTILIVDDEPGVRSSLSGVLRDEGYVVEAVSTGEACLDRVSRSPVDLIVLDVWMPGMDGLEVTRKIRARRDAKSMVPIVVITADTGSTIQQDCQDAGAQDLLLKPVAMQPLLDTICLQVLSSNPDMEMI